MKYLLDTDTIIDFIQDRGSTRKRITALTEAEDLIGLCAIIVAELQSGVSQKNYRMFSDWLKSLPYWHISREAAGQAGIERKTAAEAGRTLHVSDCLIAACAREQGAIVDKQHKRLRKDEGNTTYVSEGGNRLRCPLSRSMPPIPSFCLKNERF